jgi:DNA-binding transcriptional regulator YbjK
MVRMSSPAPAPALSPRRRQLLDAALHVVADEGLRGLTHRAVDRRAGLPQGSCSAYLRTRRALQAALTEYVAGTLAADVAELAVDLQGCEGAEDRAVELTLRLFLRWLDERELLLAKLELSMEASRDPELARLLAAYRSRLVEVVDGIMAVRGKDGSNDRAEALVASFDGILIAALQKPDRARQAFLARSLQLLMTSMAGPATAEPTRAGA